MPHISKSLSDWLDYIAQLHSSSIDLGLSRILPLAQQLNLTRFDCPVVVVAGTNGKGSVVRSLESIYVVAGYHVMAYTSPQLMAFNERLRINGDNSGDADWEAAFATIEAARDGCSLSFFEYVTLAALWICQQKKPELMLLEVGLGGRLDAVNVVKSDVAVVTNVALDHIDWLGDTREKIAFEKGAIFSSSDISVCGDPEPPDNLEADYHYRRDYNFQQHDSDWEWSGPENRYANLPLPELKLQNVATALMVTTLLKLPLTDKAVSQGVANAKLAGRYERYPDYSVIVDVAHNPQSCAYLAQRFAEEKVSGKRYAVIGMLKDKAISDALAPFIKLIDSWWVADLSDTARGDDGSMIQQYLSEQQLSYHAATDVKTALAAVLAQAQPEDSILVFGSFHTVAAAKQLLESEPYAAKS